MDGTVGKAPPPGRRRRRLGDRYDGRRIRTLDPFYQITPYIMRTRVDSHVYFEDSLDIGRADAWLREQRDSGHPGLGYLHVFIAALVRAMSQRPKLNRFVAGQKIYARGDLTISLAIKKRLDADSPETTVKLRFEPTDTIWDVERKVNEAVLLSKDLGSSNNTDRAARLFMLIPGFILRFVIWVLRCLDFVGLLPKAIHRASPFHTSAFVTDMGSLGIRPIFHHLYDFGTTSIFVAFGAKERRREINKEGQVEDRKYLSLKVVGDERICDGQYYASAFRYILGFLKDPKALALAPENVVEDQD